MLGDEKKKTLYNSLKYYHYLHHHDHHQENIQATADNNDGNVDSEPRTEVENVVF